MDFETVLLEWASLHGNCAVNGIPEYVYSSFNHVGLRGKNIRFKNGIFRSRKSTEYIWSDVLEDWELQTIMSFDEVVAEMTAEDISLSSVPDLEDIL